MGVCIWGACVLAASLVTLAFATWCERSSSMAAKMLLAFVGYLLAMD